MRRVVALLLISWILMIILLTCMAYTRKAIRILGLEVLDLVIAILVIALWSYITYTLAKSIERSMLRRAL